MRFSDARICLADFVLGSGHACDCPINAFNDFIKVVLCADEGRAETQRVVEAI